MNKSWMSVAKYEAELGQLSNDPAVCEVCGEEKKCNYTDRATGCRCLCESCHQALTAGAAALGRSRSPAKAAASRENGKRGGRPAYRYAVTVCYDSPYGPNGTVLSKHTTRELAETAERKYTGGFTGILAL